MMNKNGRAAVAGRPFERSWIDACLVLLLLFSQLWTELHACVMSAMISSRPLNSFPRVGLPNEFTAYNDPWDYFSFIMANSLPYSNSDGYGVIAYRQGSLLLEPQQRWYKRVVAAKDFGNKYYTGRYPDSGEDPGLWDHDVLDRAMYGSLATPTNYHTLMMHARNASAVSYGSHPFVYQLRDRSLAFMHNGNCYSARNYMIQRIREINPYENWFVKHPSDYFHLTDPYQWVDSELLFHFIINHIILKDNDILAGIGSALWELMPWTSYYGAPSFNFIMADGERLYAFRNTPLTGQNSHYKLSYRGSENSFWAIRTLYPQPGDLQLGKLELVVFSRQNAPQHYPGLTDLKPAPLVSSGYTNTPGKDTYTYSPGLKIYPNPLRRGARNLNLSVWLPELSGRSEGSVAIYNMRAQLVSHRPLVTNDGKALLSIDLPDLASGLYLCSVKIGERARMLKFSILDRPSD